MAFDLYQKAERVFSRSDNVCDALRRRFSTAFQFLNDSEGAGSNRELGPRRNLLKGTGWQWSRFSERVGHRRSRKTGYFLFVAGNASRVSKHRRDR